MADTGTRGALVPPPPVKGRIPIDTIDLGNRVIVYYSDGTSEAIDKGRLGSDGGSGASITTANIQAQSAADALREQERQFNELFGYNKARGDQQQQVSEGALSGYFRGAPTLAREQFGENVRQFDTQSALDYYKRLQDIASNPRNYALNFFLNRGQQAPASAAGMGNTPVGLSAMQPFGQFLQQFIPSLHGGAAPTGAPAGAGAPQPQVAPQSPADYSINPFTKVSDPGLPAGTGYLPNGSGYIAALDPKTGVPTGTPKVVDYGVQSIPGLAGKTQGMTKPDLTAQSQKALATPQLQAQAVAEQSRVAPGQKPRFVGPGGVLIYDNGGVIEEPVYGEGAWSGQDYIIGGSGPEAVTPLTPPSASSAPVGGDRSQSNPFMPYGDNAAGVEGNPFQALAADGATPPFLQRIYGQQQDNAAFGTNTTQRFALPQGVPLVSSMAFQQMSPSEREALLSLISASGIDPADYLSQMSNLVPSGAPQQSRIAYQGQ